MKTEKVIIEHRYDKRIPSLIKMRFASFKYRLHNDEYKAEFLDGLKPPPPLYDDIECVKDGRYIKCQRDDKDEFYSWFVPAKEDNMPLLVVIPGYESRLKSYPDVSDKYNMLFISPLGYSTPFMLNYGKAYGNTWPTIYNTLCGFEGGYSDWLMDAITVIKFIEDENLADRIMNNARDEVESLFSEYSYASRKTRDNSQLIQELNDKIKNLFAVSLPQERLNQDALISVLQNDLTEKETLAGKENLNMFIRYQYVQVIDKKWLDQLQALESLREAVSLRSYGSKNPLTEYKNDGFDMFDEMLDSIRTQVMSRVFKVRVQLSPEAQAQRKIMAERMQQKMNAQHSEAQSISQVQQRNAQTVMSGESARRQAQNSVMQSRTQSSTVTVRRSSPKVGRNDPCPCGSGKKYKQCCGRN